MEQHQDFLKEIVEIEKTIPVPATKEIESTFFKLIKYTIHLVLQDKEILIFSLLQIALTCTGYILWINGVRMLAGDYTFALTMPPPEAISDSSLLTSLSIVSVLLAGPIGFLNACIGATYKLRLEGKQPKIGDSIRFASSHLPAIFQFDITDTNKTVQYPINLFINVYLGKRDVIASEFMAWKLATIGMLPSLLNGQTIENAQKESVILIKERLRDILLLYHGYQYASFIACVFPVLGFIYWYVSTTVSANTKTFAVSDAPLLFGMPVIICLVVIQLFLRPILILSSIAIYDGYRKQHGNVNMLPQLPQIKE